MMTLRANSDDLTRPGGYVVRRPRITDAIGSTLRAAFDGGTGLPEEMAGALRTLDKARY